MSNGNAVDFRKFAGHFATGVAVVTTATKCGVMHGSTVNSVTALSLDPPLYLVCLDHNSKTLQAISESRVFGINFLTRDQRELCATFASKRDEKFTGCAHSVRPGGAPLFDDALACCECSLDATYPGGDHTILVGRMLNFAVKAGEPLLFYRGTYADLEQRVAL
jgi:flavin reductase (DIM6/NTAB) family NADH-FMN oxidoreductase RutF